MIKFESKDPANSLIHCIATWTEPEPGMTREVEKQLLIGYIRRTETDDEYYFHTAEGCTSDELEEIASHMDQLT